MDPILDPPAIFGEAVAGQAAKRAHLIRAEITGLSQLVASSTFDLAALLAEVKGASYYGSWGYQTFPEYAEMELGMKASKAHYLVRIHNIMKQLGIERETYDVVNISKLREIVRLNPEDFYFNPKTGENEILGEHIIRLVDIANDLTVKQVSEEVKRLLGLVGDDEITWWNVAVKRIVREKVILPALELCRQKMGSAGKDEQGSVIEYTDGAVLEMICAEYISDPNNSVEDGDMFLADILKDYSAEPQDADLLDTSSETVI